MTSAVFPRIAVRRLLACAFLLLCTLALGWAATTPGVTRADVSLDQDIAGHRSAALTTLAKAATAVAQPAAGIALALVVPLALLVWRRRADAAACFALITGTLAVAFVAKSAIKEVRPPSRLWVIPPDSQWSFPSGHTAVAAALALVLLVVVRGRRRPLAAVIGAVFVVVVAASRMYLGVHYLPDVIGSCLGAAAAAAAVAALATLPAVRTRLDPPAHRGRHADRRR
ncbi:phosphatase PAP2 family protein [Kitasatospora sp. GP82]|uniref:phosphatase PAP2 family protein n=1 Tax=Kitasatospora sp. GP82 TaxID=3035089 RepID=UPI00247621FC|nr:phosphatase PAP2 family protein [Kitasatospora sp. GP82]MDH6125018.1 membrane-associated phospholipid phosphatase [Kitasatospora sp. GP82]